MPASHSLRATSRVVSVSDGSKQLALGTRLSSCGLEGCQEDSPGGIARDGERGLEYGRKERKLNIYLAPTVCWRLHT